KVPHAAAAEKASDRELAGMTPQLIAALNLSEPLELTESWIELLSVRLDRQIEPPPAQRPIAAIPFCGCAVTVAPRIASIIEPAGIDHRPVHKFAARVVCIFFWFAHL